MNGKAGKITRLWLTMIRVLDMDRAVKFYTEMLALPVVLDARRFNHVEVGPEEPLATIGLHATGKKYQKKRRTGMSLTQTTLTHFMPSLKQLESGSRSNQPRCCGAESSLTSSTQISTS